MSRAETFWMLSTGLTGGALLVQTGLPIWAQFLAAVVLGAVGQRIYARVTR